AARTRAQERLAQPRRRVVLHDPGRALGAQHAAVHGMTLVALDVADRAVAQAHLDAAAAGTHVAGRILNLVGDGSARRDRRIAKALAHLRCCLRPAAATLTETLFSVGSGTQNKIPRYPYIL